MTLEEINKLSNKVQYIRTTKDDTFHKLVLKIKNTKIAAILYDGHSQLEFGKGTKVYTSKETANRYYNKYPEDSWELCEASGKTLDNKKEIK